VALPPPEPQLDDDARAAFQRARDEYHAGFFFECHDTLEELWSGLRGPSRDFFQGLIQVSVAFYHLGNGNTAGARSLLERALARLSRYPAHYAGLDVERLRGELVAWRARLAEGGVDGFTPEQAPRWAARE
jgi:predicted metal-dependent hydrolase